MQQTCWWWVDISWEVVDCWCMQHCTARILCSVTCMPCLRWVSQWPCLSLEFSYVAWTPKIAPVMHCVCSLQVALCDILAVVWMMNICSVALVSNFCTLLWSEWQNNWHYQYLLLLVCGYFENFEFLLVFSAVIENSRLFCAPHTAAGNVSTVMRAIATDCMTTVCD